MAIFDITNPDTNETISIEGDTPPTQQDASDIFAQMSQPQEQLRSEATPEERLTGKERLSTGFRTKPQEFLEQRREEVGLAPGTPLEPTGFNVENLKDFPKDVLDAIGPAFPAVGQILGGLTGGAASIPTTGGTASPGAIAIGGIVGGGYAEALRQRVGDLLGFDQGTVGQRLSKVGGEAALSAVGEGASLTLNLAMKATKKGLVKAGTNLLNKHGIDKFNQMFGQFARNMKPAQIKAAQDILDKGGKNARAILNPEFGTDDAAMTFSRRVLFGREKEGIAAHIKRLTNLGTPEAKAEIRQMFKQHLQLDDAVIDTLSRKGAEVNKFADEGVLFNLGNKVKEVIYGNTKSGTKGILNDIGNQLGKEKLKLAKKAGKDSIGQELSAANASIIGKLSQVGFLKPVSSGGQTIGFEINEKYAITQTGKAQEKVFKPLIERLFKKEVIGADDIVNKAIAGGAKGKELANVLSSAKRKEFFTPVNDLSYGKFVGKLSNLDAQISGNEFKAIGELSPVLTGYLQGLRGVTKQVAERHNFKSVINLTDEFSKVSEITKPLRTGDMENFFRSISNKNALYGRLDSAHNIDKLLAKKGVNLFDTIDNFNAAQALKPFETNIAKGTATKSLVGDIDAVFSPAKGSRMDLSMLEKNVDKFMPKDMKIGEFALVHNLSKELDKSAISLLRARFLSNAIPIAPALGAATGGLLGGGVGGSIMGLGGGMMLQDPRIFRSLLKLGQKSANEKLLTKITAQEGAKQLPAGAGAVGSQLLRQLISSSSE